MDKDKSIVELLVELDKVLKLETKEEAHMYYSHCDSEDRKFRAQYVKKICEARRLLGLSTHSGRIIALRASRRVFRAGE